jgi:hypothetical protein
MVISANGLSTISTIVSRSLRIWAVESTAWRISFLSLGVISRGRGPASLSLRPVELHEYRLEFECHQVLTFISRSGTSVEGS